MPKTNDAALDAFIAAKSEIDVMLERLKAFGDDHFETHPDESHWGHVGVGKHYAGLPRQITDSAFKEGEHAAGRADEAGGPRPVRRRDLPP